MRILVACLGLFTLVSLAACQGHNVSQNTAANTGETPSDGLVAGQQPE